MDKGLTCPVTAVSLGATLARHTVGTQCMGLGLFSLRHAADLTEASSFTKVTCALQVKSPQSGCLRSVESVPGHVASRLNFLLHNRMESLLRLTQCPFWPNAPAAEPWTLKEEPILHRSQSCSLFAPLFQCLQHLIIDSSNLMCQLGSGRASGKMSGSQGLSALCLGFYLHNFMWLEP